MQITVIGSGDKISEEIYAKAEAIGRGVARRGAVLVCGGRGGVMEAACKGAKAEGGVSVGILPGSEEDANPYVDVKIPTRLGFSRNSLVSQSGDAVIAVSGAIGTYTEIGFAAIFKKPVVLLEGCGGVSGNWDALNEIPEIKKKFESFELKLFRTSDPEEAVEIAVREAGK